MINVRVEGAAELAASLDAAAQSMTAEVQAAMKQSLLLIESDARRLVPQDTRRLQGSITSRVSGLTGEVGPSETYGLYVHEGRRAGARMPPPRALAGWAQRHGLPTDRGTLFVLARAIGRQGIKAVPYMTQAWETNRARIEVIFAGIGVKVVGRVSTR